MEKILEGSDGFGGYNDYRAIESTTHTQSSITMTPLLGTEPNFEIMRGLHQIWRSFGHHQDLDGSLE